MPFEALRFIHAANLHLDHPLRETGPLTKDCSEIVEDATLIAFDNVVEACVEHDVDFLLLTGNCFDEQDQSLRSQLALRSGFSQLEDEGIQVFVVPGETDPLAAWKSIHNLPENLTVFSTTSDEPVAVIREKHVIATIAPVSNRKQSATSESEQEPTITSISNSDRTAPFSIGLMNDFHDSLANCDVDYVAVQSVSDRRTDKLKERIAHNPGSVQAMSSTDLGPRGCTLVDVQAEGDMESTFLPMAPVCWEQFTIEVDEHSNLDEVVDTMHSTLKNCRQQSCEEVWLIDWVLKKVHSQSSTNYPRHDLEPVPDQAKTSSDNRTSSNSLFTLMNNKSFQDELIEFCEQDSPLPAELKRIHRIEFELIENHVDEEASTGRFATEYFEHLDREFPVTTETLQHTLDAAHLPDAPWTKRLRSMTGELHVERISEIAQQQGMAWFRTVEEEGPST